MTIMILVAVVMVILQRQSFFKLPISSNCLDGRWTTEMEVQVSIPRSDNVLEAKQEFHSNKYGVWICARLKTKGSHLVKLDLNITDETWMLYGTPLPNWCCHIKILATKT